MATCADIGISRRQRVFAVLEDACGTLKFPSGSGATLGFIRPAGDATLNQNPTFTDSEEKIDSLDVLDQFQGAVPPGEWSIPTYLRPSGTVGDVPQGDALYQSLQGLKITGSTASASATIATAAVTFPFQARSGELPEKGVITIGSEKLYYGTKTVATPSATSGTLSNITRGYDSTTAATHATDALITLSSVFYKQATTSPSFSLWIETDHFVQGLSGCAVNQATFSVNNEGAVMVTFTGQGMQMVWAGTDALTAQASGATTILDVVDADRFSVDSRIYNETQSDDNSDAGYTISAVNATTNKLTISPATSATWATSDVIRGFLPEATVIGTAVEGRYTDIEINHVEGKFINTDLTVDAPKQFITDEIGTDYPESYVENVRNISSSMNVYFRKADARYFAEGYRGNETPILISYKDQEVELYMRRCKLEVPTISFSAPTVQLQMPLKALGEYGEDSLEIVFNN